MNSLGISPSTLITTRLQSFSLFHVHFCPIKSSLRCQAACERIQVVSQSCHVLSHLRYSVCTRPTCFNGAISPCTKVLSYILYDGPATRTVIGQKFLQRKETNAMLSIYHGRQGQLWCSGPDWDRCEQQHQQLVWRLPLSWRISNLPPISSDRMRFCLKWTWKDGSLRVDWKQTFNWKVPVEGNDLPRPYTPPPRGMN